ncbi:hypothetical protein AMATHDRAFT_155258 [Amanita thiersii Skay4041]|uniref:RPA43 OB domain-containing protein n=1 Tax=Amanita thiersii Skay4041 TaxID=703135 RepID=A0A2A9NAP9_9AGAR|nr:hypothetical protein AMATHDRAFT_155258 [Amanita thiersii Skay4041]
MISTLDGSKKRKTSSPLLAVIVTKKPRIATTDGTKCKPVKRVDEFLIVKANLVVSITPAFTSDARAGVEEVLDSMVMKYNPTFQGVVVSHSNISFLCKTAFVQVECPYLVCKVSFDIVVWSPQVGVKLVGKINAWSPDHVSLLIHETFNASIPRRHIPNNTWYFKYGTLRNDTHRGYIGSNIEEEGMWVHRATGDRLGDEGYLEFTVIGLIVANEMLSLLGSLQPDPFLTDPVVR